MVKSKFPRRISRMIQNGYNKGWNAREIADHINSSRVAEKASYKVTTGSIAAKMANFTRAHS